MNNSVRSLAILETIVFFGIRVILCWGKMVGLHYISHLMHCINIMAGMSFLDSLKYLQPPFTNTQSANGVGVYP